MNSRNMARGLVEAGSPSGEEAPAMRVAEQYLREAGLQVERQAFDGPERFNVLAWTGRPRALLTTHLDTVPGELDVRVHAGRLHGRGACDAKGSAAAMIAAAADLVQAGETDFGILFVVGEETDSDGAIAANELIASGALDWNVSDTLLAEPTDGCFVTAHPGVAVARLHASGRCAHSAFPEEGTSAVHALLDSLGRIRATAWPVDPELGATRLNIGQLEGGSAANVLAGEASARLMLRSGATSAQLRYELEQAVGPNCRLDMECESEPVRFELPAPGFDAEVSGAVPFATDAPFLSAAGRLSLCGPGSIRLAHTNEESIGLNEIDRAHALYASWLRQQLSCEESVV